MPYRKENVEQNKQGKVRKRGDSRVAFDSPLAKRWVHSRFGRPDNRPGWWILHQQVTDDYCKQLVGEEWRDAEGQFVQVGENHYLDCEAMQYVMSLRDKLARRKTGAITLAQLKDAIKVAQAEPLEAEPPVDEASQEAPATPEPENVSLTAPPKRGGRYKINRKR